MHGSITPTRRRRNCRRFPANHGGLYPAGTEVHLTPVPNEGYEFDHWTEDLGGSDVPGVIVMDANKHVKAEFVEIAEGELPGEGEGEGVYFELRLGLGAVSPSMFTAALPRPRACATLPASRRPTLVRTVSRRHGGPPDPCAQRGL